VIVANRPVRAAVEATASLREAGECQGSCRLNSVMIPPIDDAAVLAA
jgi:hypothetical protein